jgi:hypothetical protein
MASGSHALSGNDALVVAGQVAGRGAGDADLQDVHATR